MGSARPSGFLQYPASRCNRQILAICTKFYQYILNANPTSIVRLKREHMCDTKADRSGVACLLGQRPAIGKLFAAVAVLVLANIATSGAAARKHHERAPVSVSSVAFEAQHIGTLSPPKVLTVTNHDLAPLFIFNVRATEDYTVRHNCTHALRQHESCQIFVKFSPAFPGITPGTVSILDSSQTSPHVLTVSGAGVPFSQTAQR